MAVDPSDPDTFEDESAEEAREIDVEAPENDAAEQSEKLTADKDDPLEDVDPARGNEADLVEQHRVVSLDEDDYR
ncbi:hypothetical protein LXH13_26270 [Streptomyces spinosirectus]|jgi:hypothetical protein|uniref:hypothetical protein n=1 Tax=Streptomyces TaxID=1883 RepID=UPI000D3CF0E9|nr:MULTISPECIES: hypothetical protein [Streptomyces]MBY8341322.1 hypothetical protein [Streptomyces plumbidurans]PTM91333.1 hypothetical protein C7821_111308 [Streptomyces sp. VMFN-G11Ma]UIR20322.1 hypothetical protein LXH13_26270 [Streptomyces spinosirectus]